MKMTSDAGIEDVASSRKETSDYDPSASAKTQAAATVAASSRLEVKNRLTFSIDSLVGKGANGDREDSLQILGGKASQSGFSEGSLSRGSPRSPSPSPKRLCTQPPQPNPKMATLPKTPPANGSEFAVLSEQHQRYMRQSAFVPPPVSSGPVVSSFVAPVSLTGPVSGSRLCWDLASVEPSAGLWKDAVAASMYQAAAAAAFCTGYPWYAPAAPVAPNEMAKKQQLFLQQDQQSMTLMSPPERPEHRHHHGQQNHAQTAGMMASVSDQNQTFWHHHIAELLRQNGGHPVHHSRLYAGPDAGHAAANFLFSGCRKPKRIRTAFSPNQLMELEAAFEKNQYVVGNERKELARRLALTETQVKVWFQNRRTKAKRMKNEDNAGTPGAASSSSSTSSASVTTKTTTAATTAPSYQQRNPDDKRSGDAEKETLEISVPSNATKSGSEIGHRASSVSSVVEDQAQIENDEELNETEFQSSDEDSD